MDRDAIHIGYTFIIITGLVLVMLILIMIVLAKG